MYTISGNLPDYDTFSSTVVCKRRKKLATQSAGTKKLRPNQSINAEKGYQRDLQF